MYLVKFKKNDIFEAIVAAGLVPEHFDLDPGEEEWRLEHIASGSMFLIRPEGAYYAGTYLVAGHGITWPYGGDSWYRVTQHIKSWLGDVKMDIETPDLWEELRKETKLLGAGPGRDVENTPFTPKEQEEIAKRLQELSDHVKRTYPLSQAQALQFDANIAYLDAAKGRLGRIDWRAVFVGTIVQYLFDVALPADAARDILLRFLTGTTDFFGNAIQALPIG